MNKNHDGIITGTGVAPTCVRFNPAKRLWRHNFLLAVALVTLGLLGMGDALAQTPPGGIPNAKTTIARTAPAKVAVTDKDREYMQMAIDKMRQAGVVDNSKTTGKIWISRYQAAFFHLFISSAMEC